MTDHKTMDTCPRCGARIYPGDIACQLCGYVMGSDDDPL